MTIPPPTRRLNLALLLLTSLLALSSAGATTLGIFTVHLPVYQHGSDGDAKITVTAVPFASAHGFPEAYYNAISCPFVPPTDGSWKEPEDVNLASQYGIKVSAIEDMQGDVQVLTITIDASAAKVPEGYPFTLDQAIDAITTCVKIMTPAVPQDEKVVKIVVKQPATAGSKKSAKEKR